MDDAYIHLRVPASTKARWIRESRAAGMRLTDWIVERVESTMSKQIDLTHGAGETETWYVTVSPSYGGTLLADVQPEAPEWTADYYAVKTPAWYPGTEDEWRRDIGRQVLEALAQRTAA